MNVVLHKFLQGKSEHYFLTLWQCTSFITLRKNLKKMLTKINYLGHNGIVDNVEHDFEFKRISGTSTEP